jgi:hypothetical protein
MDIVVNREALEARQLSPDERRRTRELAALVVQLMD